jgi:mercuric ion binding protein
MANNEFGTAIDKTVAINVRSWLMPLVNKMIAKRISTALLVITSITFLVVLAFRVRAGVTADSVVVLQTAGMTCGSCSSKIAKTLESLQGVAVTEVDVNGGWVIVGYDTKSVKPEFLAEKVTASGFNSNVNRILTPDQFKQITGRNVGQDTTSTKGCCGGASGGCGGNKPS